MKRSNLFPWIKGVLSMALLLGAISCAVNPVTGKKEFMLMSEEQEVALGIQSDPEVVASFGEYNNPQIQQFIQTKGTEMGKISHRSNLTYHFKVLDSPVVNAFALPGGFVYFTRGIMAHFNNEAEFAGVLGHEIGHVTARHGARQYSTQVLAQLGLVLGVAVSPDFAKFADVASVGLGLLFLKFSRDHESESDRLGVEYSTKIGYDAHQMAGFFQTINRLSGDSGGIPTFLSTHPNPLDRYQKVNQLATEWQQKAGTTNLQVNGDSYLRMIDGLVYGEDPRQGYVENSVFYHPELKFQFPVPGDWALQNMASQVQMAPKDGKALILFTLAKEKDLRSAADAALNQDSLKLVESQVISVNGLSAISMIADQVNPQTNQTVRAQIYLIQYNNMIYKFYGLSMLQDFMTYVGAFRNTMQNFKQLTDPGKINVKPDIIRIREAPRDGVLSDMFIAFGMPETKWPELAILNQMELNTPVTKGKLIKTVIKQ